MAHLRNTVPLSYWSFLSLCHPLTLYPCKLPYKFAQSIKYKILTTNKIKPIITVTSLISIKVLYHRINNSRILEQECKHFPKKKKKMEPPQNSRHQKGNNEASSVLRTHKNVRCTHTQFSNLCDLAPGICAVIKHPPEILDDGCHK